MIRAMKFVSSFVVSSTSWALDGDWWKEESLLR